MNRTHTTRTLVVISFSLMLIAASATFLLSFFLFHHMERGGDSLQAELARIHEVRSIIAERFVGEYQESDLTEAALFATVHALGDRWSHYLTQEQVEAQLRRSGNRHQGIGISFHRHEDTNEMLVVGVTPGSPAEAAGLLPGETIVVLEGHFTRDLTTEEIQQLVTDQFENYVTLTVRSEYRRMRTIEIEVKEFYVTPILYELKGENIGFIRIINFDETSAMGTVEAIHALKEMGAEGLVFDVRANPGGRLQEFLSIMDYLLPEGEIFVYEDQHGIEHVRHSGPNYLKMPMVVIVDAGSFSAAELFAAVLQEYDWAQVVGVPTSGKNRVQVIIPLSTGSGLHLSVSRYLTPGRVDLYESGGVQPDYVVENEIGGEDLQMEKALEVIERLIRENSP